MNDRYLPKFAKHEEVMALKEFVQFERIWLRGHAELNEKWVQAKELGLEGESE
jgi:hypothetical protein